MGAKHFVLHYSITKVQLGWLVAHWIKHRTADRKVKVPVPLAAEIICALSSTSKTE